MKACHVLWTKPEQHKAKTRDPRIIAEQPFGCRSWRDHLMFWTLSCHQLNQTYPGKTRLITDKVGKAILVDWLGLHYDEVLVELDDCPDFGHQFWMVGKLYSHSLQEEPFFLIDADAFLWRPFDAALENARVFCQSIEPFKYFAHYGPTLTRMKPVMPQVVKQNPVQYAINVGVLGGKDLEFFRAYTKFTLGFLKENKKALQALAGDASNRWLWGNIFVEQYLCAVLAQSRGLRVQSVVQAKWWALSRAEKKNLPFTHLLGGSKCRAPVVARVEKRVSEVAPRIMEKLRLAA